jgi:hypothetical protein
MRSRQLVGIFSQPLEAQLLIDLRPIELESRLHCAVQDSWEHGPLAGDVVRVVFYACIGTVLRHERAEQVRSLGDRGIVGTWRPRLAHGFAVGFGLVHFHWLGAFAFLGWLESMTVECFERAPFGIFVVGVIGRHGFGVRRSENNSLCKQRPLIRAMIRKCGDSAEFHL